MCSWLDNISLGVLISLEHLVPLIVLLIGYRCRDSLLNRLDLLGLPSFESIMFLYILQLRL